MSGTISGTLSSGITLSSSFYADPITIAGEIDAANGDALVAPTDWTIDITGALYASLGDGIVLEAGGSIDNVGIISAAGDALISTSGKGFQIENQAAGTIIGSGADAVRLSGDVSTSTLLNDGLIEAGGGGTSLQLGAASATNGSTGIIQGGSVGVELGNVSEFVNYGNISGATGILVPSGQNYVSIVDAGLVSASAGDAISFAAGSAGSVTDYLTLLPGAVLNGMASGGQVADLVFAGSIAGTMADVAQDFILFSTVSVATGADWQFSGTSALNAAFQNDGRLVERAGDFLTFESVVAGSGMIDLAGGFVAFTNVVEAGQTVMFDAANATMLFNQAHAFGGTISGFTSGDTIEVTGFGVSQQVTSTLSGDVLTLNDGMTPVTITFASPPGSLVVEPIGGTNPKTYEIMMPCFREHTRLLTPDGLRPVEALREGDLLVTRSGAIRPIIWHGSRRVDCRRHPRVEAILPILVEQDAFGPGLPCRDLYLSPDHALWFDGILIEVKHLTNGLSVRQIEVAEVTYHHVELATHDVILAEMLPAETYLDCHNRHQFISDGGPISLYADFAVPQRDENRVCAPLLHEGAVIEALRGRLHRDLAAQGWQQVPGELAAFAGGNLLVPTAGYEPRWMFRLPESVEEVEISSTASRPAELDLRSFDNRLLGVAIRDVTLDGRVLDMRDSCFGKGFHEAEFAESGWFRWTNGRGRIDVSGGRCLAFRVQAVAAVWRGPKGRRMLRQIPPRQILVSRL